MAGTAPSSPTIDRLRQALERGDQAAAERLWDALAAQGTPLIEPLEGDDEHVLLTLLWRAAGPQQSVAILGGPGGWGSADAGMRQLLDSQIWYRSYRVHHALRTTYQLGPDDPLTPLEEMRPEEWAPRMASWRPDPLNPRRLGWEEGGLQRTWSILELPGAPSEAWHQLRPDVPAGRVEHHRLASDVLGNERDLSVYTPPCPGGARAARGLLVLLDGALYEREIATPTILDNLLAEGRLPPLLAIFVGNPDHAARARELSCHEPFVAFLADELLPWVRRRYRVRARRGGTIIGGASAGGLAALFAALRRPEIFGAVLAQSGAFWLSPPGEVEHAWLAREIGSTRRQRLRISLEVGLLEHGATPGGGPSLLAANRHMRDVLRARGYAPRYVEYHGGHDLICWRSSLAAALCALCAS